MRRSSSLQLKQNPSANGCLYACITALPKSEHASFSSATVRSLRVGKAWFSWCLISRRPQRPEISFILRDTTAQRTIGGGKFLDLRAPARKRRTPERLAQLAAHALVEPQAAFSALLEQPPFFVDLSAFARDRALSAENTAGLLERCNALKLITANAVLAMSATQWLTLKRVLLGTLDKFHSEHPDLPGIGIEPLRMQLQRRLPTPGLLSFLQNIAKSGDIALDGAWVRLSKHSVRLTDTDERLWAKMAPLLGGQERFRPPRIRDMAGVLGAREGDVRRLLKLLGRMGKVDEIAHDHFFLRGTVAEMVDIIIDVSANATDGQFSAAQFRDRLNNGRKVAIQILEFFDRHGVTLRRGDVRRINKHRIDLFRRVDGATIAEKPVQEENRPRWGVRTSNPGGTASRSWWVELPLSFRHVQRECNETRAILSPCEAGHRNAKDLRRYPGAKRRQCPGVAPTEAAHVR